MCFILDYRRILLHQRSSKRFFEPSAKQHSSFGRSPNLWLPQHFSLNHLTNFPSPLPPRHNHAVRLAGCADDRMQKLVPSPSEPSSAAGRPGHFTPQEQESARVGLPDSRTLTFASRASECAERFGSRVTEARFLGVRTIINIVTMSYNIIPCYIYHYISAAACDRGCPEFAARTLGSMSERPEEPIHGAPRRQQTTSLPLSTGWPLVTEAVHRHRQELVR